MKGSNIAAALSGVFLLSLVSAASAQMGTGRTVTGTGSDTMSTATCTVSRVGSSGFVCGGQFYQVTSATAFSGAPLDQLAGKSVTVAYHMSDGAAVADSVTAG